MVTHVTLNLQHCPWSSDLLLEVKCRLLLRFNPNVLKSEKTVSLPGIGAKISTLSESRKYGGETIPIEGNGDSLARMELLTSIWARFDYCVPINPLVHTDTHRIGTRFTCDL